jgi:hypothetical protein
MENVVVTVWKLIKEKSSVRRVSMELGMDRASLYRSLKKGTNPRIDTIVKFLDHLGYQLQVVKVRRFVAVFDPVENRAGLGNDGGLTIRERRQVGHERGEIEHNAGGQTLTGEARAGATGDDGYLVLGGKENGTNDVIGVGGLDDEGGDDAINAGAVLKSSRVG